MEINRSALVDSQINISPMFIVTPKTLNYDPEQTRRLTRLEIQSRKSSGFISRVFTIGMEKIQEEIEQCRYRYDLRQEVQKSTEVS